MVTESGARVSGLGVPARTRARLYCCLIQVIKRLVNFLLPLFRLWPFSTFFVDLIRKQVDCAQVLSETGLSRHAQNKLVLRMIRMNSSSLISPSPSRSASSIISYISSSVMFSPSSLATRFKFLKEILPVSSSSNRRKAFIISSRGSLSAIF